MPFDAGLLVQGAMKGLSRAMSGRSFGCHSPTTGVVASAMSGSTPATPSASSSETDSARKIRILKLLVGILIGADIERKGE